LIGVDVPEPPSGEHEVWYLLQRRLWGRGFGSEALEQLMTVVQGLKHVKKAVAATVVENVASWRILERNGFHRDAMIPGGFVKAALRSDLLLYSKETEIGAQPGGRPNAG
jgi:RimJ/RimL family protein N-acetyltransferase